MGCRSNVTRWIVFAAAWLVAATWWASPCVAADGGDGTSAADEAAARPLKVFILAGQSNMQGHAEVRTIDAMALDPETARLQRRMLDRHGDPVVCDRVWISSLGSAPEVRTGRLTAGFGAAGRGPKIGPEFTFGIRAHERLDEPILIIKTAWGGKSLHTDFRPPSAGPYTFSATERARLEQRGEDVAAKQAERTEASGRFYRLMMEHVRGVLADIPSVVPGHDPDDGYELAGFVWFQGWNDMVDGGVYPERGRPGGYDAYAELMTMFIQDVRRDLDAPALPFVIGVMGVGGPIDQYGPNEQRYAATHGNFRDAMAAPAERPEFAGTVTAVRTAQFWDMETKELRRRDRALDPERTAIDEQVKAGTMSREDARVAKDRLDRANFSERERRLLRESVSNAEYHYLGSARIIGPIGAAFAEAVLDLGQAGGRR